MRRPTQRQLTIVFEDDDILVIDKPPGLLTSTVPREKRPTALAMVRVHVAETSPGARVGLIHRLDRDASGLLIFSKNHGAYVSLKRQFFEHSVKRIYFALIAGAIDPLAGRIESRLVELPDGSVHSTRVSGKGERAVTHYKTVRRNARYSLLRVMLETGRKHQIRAHLSERGAPIVNDPMYGSGKRTGMLMLVAAELEFTHPRSGKPMRFELGLPREISQLIRS